MHWRVPLGGGAARREAAPLQRGVWLPTPTTAAAAAAACGESTSGISGSDASDADAGADAGAAPLDKRPAPPILQLTLTPTSRNSLATTIALAIKAQQPLVTIGPASGSVVSAVHVAAADALTPRVAPGPSSAAAVFGEVREPSMSFKAKAPPEAPAAPGRVSCFEGFMASLGFQSCFSTTSATPTRSSERAGHSSLSRLTPTAHAATAALGTLTVDPQSTIHPAHAHTIIESGH